MLLLGRQRGSPCERLRPSDATKARIRRRSEASALMSVTLLLRGYERASVTENRRERFYYAWTGRGAVDTIEQEQRSDVSCGRTRALALLNRLTGKFTAN